MENGGIVEEGTYDVGILKLHLFVSHVPLQSLMSGSAIFASLMEEYGSRESQAGNAERKAATDRSAGDPVKGMDNTLMQTEERNVGAVPWATYEKYLGYAGGGLLWAPIIIALLLLDQAANGGFGIPLIRY